MSLTAPLPTPPNPSPSPSAEEGPRRPGSAALWVRVAMAVLVLAGSFALRSRQAGQVNAAMRSGRASPFQLKELPMELGHWRGKAEVLDQEIARATGCTDHAFRSYTDERTGQVVGVIVLYGPAAEIFIHAPDNCYPAQGYTVGDGPFDRSMVVDRDVNVPLKRALYVRGEGGQADHQEVYHTWWYDRRWTPQLPIFKQAERIPGMLKVHVTRRVLSGEYRDAANPCEDFLAQLLPAIQRRLDEALARPSPASTPTLAGR